MIKTNYIFMANNIVDRIYNIGLGVVAVLGIAAGAYNLSRGDPNLLHREGTKYVKIAVKKGDTLERLTLACTGRPVIYPNNEDTKYAIYDAVNDVTEENTGRKVDPFNLSIGQELYVPLTNDARNLDYCLERAEKDDNGNPEIFRLLVDEGRHYLVRK